MPQRDAVLVTAAIEKLRQKRRLCNWAEYTALDGALGEARPGLRRCTSSAARASLRPRSPAWHVRAYSAQRRVLTQLRRACTSVSCSAADSLGSAAHGARCVLTVAHPGRTQQGTFGKVLRVHKNDGGAEYAVKVFNSPGLGDVRTHEVMSEVKALFKARSPRRAVLKRVASQLSQPALLRAAWASQRRLSARPLAAGHA